MSSLNSEAKSITSAIMARFNSLKKENGNCRETDEICAQIAAEMSYNASFVLVVVDLNRYTEDDAETGQEDEENE